LDDTVRPGTARLFSLLAVPPGTNRDASSGGGSFSSAQPNRPGGGEPGSTESLKQAGSQLLSKCAELIASIDGVFFDDGTFVGPDQAGLFDQVKTQVEAKLEL